MLKLNLLRSLFVATLFAFSSITVLADETTLTVNAATDYIVDGFTRTDGQPVIQGKAKYENEMTDLYGSVFTSTVDRDSFAGGSAEVQYTVGWAPTYGDYGVDVSYNRYYYYDTTSDDNGVEEYKASVNYAKLVTAGIQYSDDYYGLDQRMYYTLQADVPVMGFVVTPRIGHSDYDDVAIQDYQDWSLTVSKEVQGVDLSAGYHDVSGLDNNCAGFCDAEFVFGLSKAFSL